MLDFIIIDDDPMNNLLCSRMIQLNFSEASVSTFIDPLAALERMQGHYSNPDTKNAVVFLDIDMPQLNGWEVLDEFHTFPEEVKNHFKFFILSSFVYTKDQLNQRKKQYVSGYIAKPLTKFILQETIQHRHDFFE